MGTQSQQWFERAQLCLPGGVNSPVRAFGAVGGSPPLIQRAEGAYLWDEDGQRYVDCIGAWGPMILGHAHPRVLQAIANAANRGLCFGTATRPEVEMAELIAARVPSMPMLRMTSSGTEAVMGALRLARGATGRPLVAKCAGAYHGGADYLLVKAGSGLATAGVPDSSGVPAALTEHTRVIGHNSLASARELFAREGDSVAAIIVEPVAGNMGCVPPSPGWLEGLKDLCEAHGALLVFDEVMTGFRVGRGGAQERYGVRPHITALGKIVGGGMPAGAYGGSRELMQQVAPLGPIYQAGTLSGHPLAVAAGAATLAALAEPGVYEKLETLGATLAAEFTRMAQERRLAAVVQHVGSMLTVFFSADPVVSWNEAKACDLSAFARWHQTLLAQGVYWPPSQFEAAFFSLSHDEPAVTRLLEAAQKAFDAVAAGA